MSTINHDKKNQLRPQPTLGQQLRYQDTNHHYVYYIPASLAATVQGPGRLWCGEGGVDDIYKDIGDAKKI